MTTDSGGSQPLARTDHTAGPLLPPRPPGQVLLDVTSIRAGFGSNTVLHDVSFHVREGEIACILGLNGAGKSVTMKVVAGIVPAWSGKLTLGGEDITSAQAEGRVRAGMSHVPQGRQVFPELSVEQNLRLGAYTLRRRDKSRYKGVLDSIFQRFPLLAERRSQAAGSMSGGEQATLAVARALMSEPKLMLVDEASAGLAPLMVNQVFETLREVNKSGVTILMVEQNVSVSLKIADRAHIMQQGHIVYEGDVPTLDRDKVAAYLGVGRLLGSGMNAAQGGRTKKTVVEPKGASTAPKLASTNVKKKSAPKGVRVKAKTAAVKRTTSKATKKKPSKAVTRGPSTRRKAR